ncbi:MAG: head-tail connector protein [Pseudomonadota bacterium]
MSLTLIAPPAGEPLTLDAVKAHLRVTHTDEDTLITSYLSAARRTVEARAGLGVMTQTWRLTLDGQPAGPIRLPLSPVASVLAVSVEAVGGAQTLAAEAYETQTGHFARFAPRGVWPAPAILIGGVQIDFVVGWASAAAVPDDVLQAIRLLTAHYYEHREAAHTDRLTVTPQAVDALLAPYRQVRL